MDAYQIIRDLETAAGRGYDNIEMNKRYDAWRLRLTLQHESDTVLLVAEDPDFKTALNMLYDKYLRFHGKLPEFDANRTIEYKETF